MKNKIIIALITTITCSSCTTYRYIYSASPPNNPYFIKKGESKLAAYYSSSNNDRLTKEYAHGYDLQAAYALSNHWAVTSSFFSRREKDVYTLNENNNPFDSSIIKYKRKLFDVGAGYFATLNRKKTITFNLYGGIGSGKFSFDDNGLTSGAKYSRFHNSNITKWYYQPSINVVLSEYIHFSFLIRTSFIHYSHITTSYTQSEQQYFSLDKIAGKTLGFVEPSWGLQLGLPKYPWVKIDAVVSGATHNFPDGYRLDERDSNASIGLSFDFSKVKKSSK